MYIPGSDTLRQAFGKAAGFGWRLRDDFWAEINFFRKFPLSKKEKLKIYGKGMIGHLPRIGFALSASFLFTMWTGVEYSGLPVYIAIYFASPMLYRKTKRLAHAFADASVSRKVAGGARDIARRFKGPKPSAPPVG